MDVVYLCKKRFKVQISVNFSIIRSIYCWYYSKSKLLCKLKISNMSTNGMSHSELAAFIYSFMSSTCIYITILSDSVPPGHYTNALHLVSEQVVYWSNASVYVCWLYISHLFCVTKWCISDNFLTCTPI